MDLQHFQKDGSKPAIHHSKGPLYNGAVSINYWKSLSHCIKLPGYSIKLKNTKKNEIDVSSYIYGELRSWSGKYTSFKD